MNARSNRLLATLLFVAFLNNCTGRSAPGEVRKPELSFDMQQEVKLLSRFPGVEKDTLWRIEADYLDEHGQTLSHTPADIVLAYGDWQSELAPLQITPGYQYLRDTGEFGDGPPDFYSVLHLAPEPLNMRMVQRIVPVNQTEPIPVPPGATRLQARLREVCPLQIRYMRQINRRPMGDVIAVRTVREEMHWREYRISGPCRRFE